MNNKARLAQVAAILPQFDNSHIKGATHDSINYRSLSSSILS